MVATVEAISAFVTDLTEVTNWASEQTKMEAGGELWSKAHALQARLFQYRADVFEPGEPEFTLDHARGHDWLRHDLHVPVPVNRHF